MICDIDIDEISRKKWCNIHYYSNFHQNGLFLYSEVQPAFIGNWEHFLKYAFALKSYTFWDISCARNIRLIGAKQKAIVCYITSPNDFSSG